MARAVRRWLSSSAINQWDPTTSLDLKHQTLALLEVCTNWDHFKQILAQTMRHHLITCTFPMSRLLHFSAISHPEFLTTAVVLFTYFTPNPNLYIHNIMISALSSSSSFQSTSKIYRSLLYSAISPDDHTFLPLLKSSSCMPELTQVHAHVVVTAHHSQLYIQNLLIKMYSGQGKLDMAHQVFDHMPHKDVVSFNTMISGYAKNRCYMKALDVFNTMKHTSNEPDRYTVSSILLCCGYLRYLLGGKSVHAWIIRRNSLPKWGLILINSLLEMYVKSQQMEIAAALFHISDVKDVVSWNSMIAGLCNVGCLHRARELFDEMPRRDIVSWNSILSGYAQTGNTIEVMELFKSMLVDAIKPNNTTFVTLIAVFSDIGMVNQAMCIHGHILRTAANLNCDPFVATALINMYSKCGSINKSLEIWRKFSGIRDIPMWTSIITGLALNGNPTQALKIFHQMQTQEGLMPNKITLLAVLMACVHGGSVEDGRLIFNRMKETYGIEPGIQHYGCLVDLYTRAGRLAEAHEIIQSMPVEPTRSMWGAVLSGCKEQGNVELAVDSSRQLLKLAPKEEASYILLSGTYAFGGRWGLSCDIRNVMHGKGFKKKAGWSSIIIKGDVYYFAASSDVKNIERDEICRVLSDINRELKYGTECFCASTL